LKASFIIRPIQAKDKASLALVFLAAYSHEPFAEKWSATSARKRIAQLLADKTVTGWVATVLGQPVGFSFLQVRQGAQELYGELLETAVHPYFQKQGIEQALLGGVKQFQKKKKVKNVMALVFKGVHEKMFKEAGWSKSKRTLVYVSR
jgi:ribosomal protein S18 acetylase RimI-like enzyme